MKKIIPFLFMLFLLPQSLFALELVRQKNVATYIVVPIVDADGDIVSSAAGLDSEIDAWADGSAPDGFSDCTNEATEIGSSGIYYLSLAQAEMNADYIYVQVKTSTSGAKTQHVLIRTTVGDPLNEATTDDGGTINVTSGKVDEVATLTGHTAQTGDAYAIVNSGTYGNSALKTLIDAVPTASEIQTELEENGASKLDSITDLLPASTIAAATDIPSVADIQAELEENGASTLDSISDLLPASTIAAATDIPSAANNADAVWDEVSTGHTDAGKAGAQLWTDIDAILTDTGTTLEGHLTDIKGATFSGATDSLEAIRDRGDAEWITATGFSTHSAADVWSVATRTLTAIDEDTTTLDLDGTNVGGLTTWDKAGYSLSAAGLADFFDTDTSTTYASAVAGSVVKEIADNAGGASLTEGGIADAVWNEAIADHLGAGSTGNKLNAAASAGDPWGTSLPGAYSAGTAGYIVGTNLDATVSSRSTLAATDNIGINWADITNPTTSQNLSGTTISTSQAVASVSGAVGSVTGGVTVTTNNDKTGYSLSQTFPTNFSALAITAGGAVTAGTVSDKTGYSLANPQTFNLTGNVTGNLSGSVGSVSGAVGSVTAGVTVTTNNDKTGYGLADDAITAAKIAAGAITASEAPNLDAAISTRSSHSAADVWAVASRTLSDYSGVWSVASRTLSDYSGVWAVASRTITGLTVAALADLFDTNSGTNYASAVAGSVVKEIADNAGGASLTVEDIVDGVWNELQSGHTAAGTFGQYLDAQVSLGGSSLTEEGIADAVLDELLSGHTTAGSLGKVLSGINDATDGDTESGEYTGVENLIRRHGR